MQVFHSLEALAKSIDKSAVAIGNFDGVHQGHQALLRRMIQTARSSSATATALTFYPHPVEVLRPGTHLERLTTTVEKLSILEAMGVELVLVATFDANLAALSAEDFFREYLLTGLKASSIHVGFNFKFGKGRTGDTKVLEQLCAKSKMKLEVESPFEVGTEKVSSSRIRQLIGDGEVAQAGLLLGRPYLLAGQVSAGDGRGAKLGFPTANLRYPPDKVLPKNGVYITRAIWQRQAFRSVTNIGFRPTFGGAAPERPAVEAHLLDFQAKIYDEFMQLEFLERIRDEKKFDSVDALVAQIRSDVARARGTG